MASTESDYNNLPLGNNRQLFSGFGNACEELNLDAFQTMAVEDVCKSTRLLIFNKIMIFIIFIS